MIFPWVDESLTTKYTKATTTPESQTPPLGSEESLDDLGNRLKEKVKREKIISQSALEIERIKAEEASRIKENQAELDRADRKIQRNYSAPSKGVLL